MSLDIMLNFNEFKSCHLVLCITTNQDNHTLKVRINRLFQENTITVVFAYVDLSQKTG